MSDWKEERRKAHEEIDRVLAELNLTVTSEFVPLSHSRNKNNNPSFPTLNWFVNLLKDGKAILRIEYSAGCAHCPSYKQGKLSVDDRAAINYECETGYVARRLVSMGSVMKGKPILPDTRDVIHSLVTDADVINYRSFEDWAGSFGYDTDSRSAEKTYRACLDVALKLRNGLGEENLAKLHDVFRNY